MGGRCSTGQSPPRAVEPMEKEEEEEVSNLFLEGFIYQGRNSVKHVGALPPQRLPRLQCARSYG